MKKYMAYCLGTVVGSLSLAPHAIANESLTEAFQKSTVKVNFRLRYEDVSWDGLDDVDYRTAANDLSNPGTAIITDPEGTEVSQAFVSYDNFSTQFKYGRQRIVLDNQRLSEQ